MCRSHWICFAICLGMSLDGSQLSVVASDELCLRRAIVSYRFWVKIGPLSRNLYEHLLMNVYG